MNNSTNRTVQFNRGLITPPTSPRKNGTRSGPIEVNIVITAPSTSACKLNNSSFSRDSSYPSLLTPPISPTNPGSLAWSESADAWPTLQQRSTRQRPDPIKRELHCKLHSYNPLLEPSSWSICVDGTDDRNLTSTHRRNNSLTTTQDGQETDKFGALSSLIILSLSADESKPEILSEVGILESENPSIGSLGSIRKRNTLVNSISSGPRDYSNNGLDAPPIAQDNTANRAFPSPCQERSAVSLSPFALRNSTSLRLSQWIARGSSLSPPQILSRIPDRFIISKTAK